MHVPFGWVSIVTGVLGALIFTVGKIRGDDTDFALFAASLAAFVAGWLACVSAPGLERRVRDLEQTSRTGRTTPQGE